jgi:formamidopyrimidine-DNA glycosylase
VPELPEVEVTRLSFASRITGASIEQVQLGQSLRWPWGVGLTGGAPEAAAALVGQRIAGVRRRGKYLLVDVCDAQGRAVGLILLHLGMSGSLMFAQDLPPLGKHDHFNLRTSQGQLRLHDPRRFGAAIFAYSEQDTWPHKLLSGLGVEPLTADFSASAFHAALKKRRTPIKQALLAGDIVVGVGNIYASEALFLAGIRPTLSASKISSSRTRKLHAAVVQVLQAALETGGSTLRDFSSATGQSGYFQLQANVYGRAGERCRVCGTMIKTIRQGQRSTFYCPVCQKT